MPAKFWGVVPQILPSDAHFARIKRGGVDSVRVTIDWPNVEPAKGSFNWSGVDTAVARAARHRLELLPAVWGTPSWVAQNRVVAAGGKRQADAAPGRASSRPWSAATGRRGASGPPIPACRRGRSAPGRSWNEENFFYFTKRPSPTKYAKLVKITHRAITSVDRRARMILGGMFALPAQRPPKAYAARAFLDLMYRRSPGIKRSFDGVALHPYSRSYIYLKATINQVRNVMKRHDDGRTGLWVTEVGWGSGRGNNSFEKGRKGQVRQLKGAFRVFRKNRKRWRLKRVYWFSLDDLAGTCNFCDSTGLFGAGFKAKPSWHAYVRFAGGRANAGRISSAGASAATVGRPLRGPELRSAALRAPGRLARR